MAEVEFPAILKGRKPDLDEGVFYELARLYKQLGIRDLVGEWFAEDAAARDAARVERGLKPVQGGRRVVLDPVDVLLVAHTLLVGEENALITTISKAIAKRLPVAVRRYMKLPEQEPVRDTSRYMQVQRSFQRLSNLTSPFLGLSGHRRPAQEYFDIVDATNPEEAQRRVARGLRLSNLLIEASLRVLPEQYRAAWDGTVCIDATALRVYGKRGSPRGLNKPGFDRDLTLSPESWAYWYYRDGDHGEPSDGKRPMDPQSKFGGEAHFAVQAGPVLANGRTSEDFPKLVASMTLNAPGYSPGEAAATLLASLADRGHPAGEVVSDRLYFPMAKPDVLQRPARALGYEPVHSIPRAQLGLRGNYKGMLFIDGNLYSPGMPKHLYDISIRHAKREISDAEYQALIAKRTPYLVKLKQSADEHGRMRFSCPALGKYPSVRCPIRELAKTSAAPNVRWNLPITQTGDQPAGAICEQASVTIDFADDDIARYWQKYQYMSPEWIAHYNGPRNCVEGANGHVKEDIYNRLDQPGLRRMRGYGKQLIAIALMVSAANIRAVRNYLEKRAARAVEQAIDITQPARRARRLNSSLQDHLPDLDKPAWTPGRPKVS
ncbi:hypothetical protein [Microbacterium sp. GXF6406]